MKYEKPIVRDLNGQSASGGPPIPLACLSGGTAGNPSVCAPNGAVAGDDCNPGQNVGWQEDCVNGDVVIDCISGSLAQG